MERKLYFVTCGTDALTNAYKARQCSSTKMSRRGHPEDIFEVVGVRQGLLVAPRTKKKDLGGACLDIFVISPASLYFSSHMFLYD